MLVLSRRKSEVIRISEDIEIHVLEIRKGRVRLGIEAPRNILVRRSELVERLCAAAIGGDSADTSEPILAMPSVPRHAR